MDYRNADGSVSEMCGNGIRVFARYLHEHEGEPFPMEVQTRDGAKVLEPRRRRVHRRHGRAGGARRDRGDRPRHVLAGPARVDGQPARRRVRRQPGRGRGASTSRPSTTTAVFPEGVNVEFVVRRGEHHVAMRVHERGSGETRSCGTGACAVAVVAALADDAPRGTSYRVDVPGGTLSVVWTEDDRVLMTGPAVLVAEGVADL